METIREKIQWPDWETIRQIGSGSFGAVYEIQRELPNGKIEKAALKVISIPQNEGDIEELLSSGYDSASITLHFKNYLADIADEYSLMSEIKGHTNVVYCDDIRYVQHEDGLGWDIFIKMELLTPMLKRQDLVGSDASTIRLGQDICRALILCEGKNIIHRDIKPQNIFVSDNGDFKLGDFGIAKTVEKTTGGTKIGTYGYMAPEVYNNQPYGASADICSLGLVMYWLLNERRLPFLPLPPEIPTTTQKKEACFRYVNGEPVPAPQNGSEDLKRIVLKACAYDPKARYHTAEEMLADLEAIKKGQPLPPAPDPIPDPASDSEVNIVPPKPVDSQTLQKQVEQKLLFGKFEEVIALIEQHADIMTARIALCYVCSRNHIRSCEKLVNSDIDLGRDEFIEGIWGLLPQKERDLLLDYLRLNREHRQKQMPLHQNGTVETKQKKAEKPVYEMCCSPGIICSSNSPIWGQNCYKRRDVSHIKFCDSLTDAPADAWDVSAKKDRSILAWMQNGVLSIGSEGKIALPRKSSNFFKEFEGVTTIDFSDVVVTENVTDMYSMFRGCSSLRRLDLNRFDTSRVGDMHFMFSNCSNLQSLNLTSFDTAHVWNMDYMFRGCSNLQSLNLSNFNTARVANMAGMFSDCGSLRSLDLSSFNTTRVTDMGKMFYGCSNLQSLNLCNFNTFQVTDMIYMFSGCSSLTDLKCSDSKIRQAYNDR